MNSWIAREKQTRVTQNRFVLRLTPNPVRPEVSKGSRRIPLRPEVSKDAWSTAHGLRYLSPALRYLRANGNGDITFLRERRVLPRAWIALKKELRIDHRER